MQYILGQVKIKTIFYYAGQHFNFPFHYLEWLQGFAWAFRFLWCLCQLILLQHVLLCCNAHACEVLCSPLTALPLV